MSLFRIIFSGLLTVSAGVCSAGQPYGEPPTSPDHVSVDQRPALKIGAHEVSYYLIDKYYLRAGGHVDLPNGTITPAVKSWLELYLAQQVIIAHATSTGFLERPDVRDLIKRVSRHMLTRLQGPYYQTVYDQTPISDQELHRCYLHTGVRRQTLVLHFQNAAQAIGTLGIDFTDQSTEEKLRRVSALQKHDNTDVHEGSMTWPFAPFYEIADRLSVLPTGEWLEYNDPWLGVYYAFVRSEVPQVLPEYALVRAQLEQIARDSAREACLRRHRARLLTEAKFTFDVRIAEKISLLIQAVAPGQTVIPETGVSELADEVLFRFRASGKENGVSVKTFCHEFNGLFIRKLPRDLAALRDSAENIALAELDFQAAVALGIDRAPQFIEDQRGFGQMQVLDSFERNVLRPQINPSAIEIENHYRDHVSEFHQATRVRGRLLIIGSQPATLNQSEAIEFAYTKPPAGLEPMVPVILQAPIGSPFGPIQRDKDLVTFIKDADLDIVQIPLAEMAPKIREILTRKLLDQKELQLARDLVSNFKVDDRIDYARYGTPADFIRAPWRD